MLYLVLMTISPSRKVLLMPEDRSSVRNSVDIGNQEARTTVVPCSNVLRDFPEVMGVLGSCQENISDFVAKKREMFLVQMSLDVKKAEILKLDARAKDKEEAELLVPADRT